MLNFSTANRDFLDSCSSHPQRRHLGGGGQASTTKGPLPAIIIHYVQHNPFCPIDMKLLHAYYFHRRIVYLNKKVSRWGRPAFSLVESSTFNLIT